MFVWFLCTQLKRIKRKKRDEEKNKQLTKVFNEKSMEKKMIVSREKKKKSKEKER